jgi:hypothetical protein
LLPPTITIPNIEKEGKKEKQNIHTSWYLNLIGVQIPREFLTKITPKNVKITKLGINFTLIARRTPMHNTKTKPNAKQRPVNLVDKVRLNTFDDSYTWF